MTQSAPEGFSGAPASANVAPAERALRRAGARRGLLRTDGHIYAIGDNLLDELGFEAGDDLRGLSFQNLWRHADRSRAGLALRQASRDGRAQVELDLGYIRDHAGTCLVTLEHGPAKGLLLMTLAARGRVAEANGEARSGAPA